MNYPVPNFGVDKDILATEKHLKDMEAKLGKWDFKPKSKDPEFKMNYKVNNFGKDDDISDSLASLAQAEKDLKKKWVIDQTATQQAADIHMEKEAPVVHAQIKKYTKAQPSTKSDPIHGSGDGCVHYKDDGSIGVTCDSVKREDHPINYKVQDLGMEKDVKDSIQHEKDASSTLGHNWNITKNSSSATAQKPSKTSALVGTSADINMKDDPVCLSTGCETRAANPYNDEAWKKIGYSPLDTPLEEDMQASIASNKAAIKKTGREWSIL